MSRCESPAIRCHEDVALFREAVNFTAAETAFPPRLIEKDYFCSVLLEYLAVTESSLVFKGGTCLTKVYAGFYRLSEDLDFAISTSVDASRRERRRRGGGERGGAPPPPPLSLFPRRGAGNRSKQLDAVCRRRGLCVAPEQAGGGYQDRGGAARTVADAIGVRLGWDHP